MFSGRIPVLIILAAALGGCTNQVARSPIQISNGGSLISGTKHITAASGEKIKVAFFAEVNPDCSKIDGGILRISGAPANGGTEIIKNSDFPYFPPKNPRSFCNTQRVAGTTIFYRSKAGFTGTDTFTYDWFNPFGQQLHVNVTADVR